MKVGERPIGKSPLIASMAVGGISQAVRAYFRTDGRA
jgi:hypothetical protein